jgi:hypothetical protein
MHRRLIVVAVLAALAAILPGTAMADDHASSKITLCHANGHGGWESLQVDDSAVLGGHEHHADDIIPPFSYGTGGREHYDGHRWSGGDEETWRDDCHDPNEREDTPRVTITFAARVCSSYADVFANRSRDNLMESLQQLGSDSPYAAGEEVLPAIENRGRQAGCAPISGWRFTLGSGTQDRADVGAWGALSKVTGAFAAPEVITRPSAPLKNVMGGPTGMTIAGAVTVRLTDAQVRLAQSAGRLWVQGGVPGDPLLTSDFGDRYSYATLRCSVDNLYGNNVEFVQIPLGHTNVFCFEYLVDERPHAGTVTIVKKVESPTGAAVEQRATYSGSLSYADGGLFSMVARTATPASMSFVRNASATAGAPWTAIEVPRAGWTLRSAECTSRTGESTATTATVNAAAEAGRVSVALAAGDHVTCTFTNVLAPPPSTLALTPITIGGSGTFPLTVTGPDGTHAAAIDTAQPLSPGAPVTVALTSSGTYHVESAPASGPAGSWSLTRVLCNGAAVPIIDGMGFDIQVDAGTGISCALTSTFTPGGSIVLRKATNGATGATGFVVASIADPTLRRLQRAVTQAAGPGGAAIATGESTSALPLGRYVISETRDAYVGSGDWTLESVTCNGEPVASAAAAVTVELTERQPRLDCTFTNMLATPFTFPLTPLAPASTGSYPPSGPGSPTMQGEASGLAMSRLAPVSTLSLKLRAKRLGAKGAGRLRALRIDTGSTVRYAGVLVAHGGSAARNVTVVFRAPKTALPTRFRSSRGRCTGRRTITCLVGTLLPGQRVTLIGVRRILKPGRFRLMAATNSATSARSMRNAAATITIRAIG